jgi:hypothetical protein
LQLEVFRGQRRQPPHRLLQRNHLLVAYVFAEQAREVAECARMWIRFEEHALGGERAGVGIEADPRQRDLPAHVLLRHQEIHRADAAVVLDDEIHGGLFRRRAAQTRDLAERLPRQVLERVLLERDEQHALR